MKKFYYVEVYNKKDGKFLGSIIGESYDGICLGTYSEMVTNEYFWYERGRDGAIEFAKRYEKKFGCLDFYVKCSTGGYAYTTDKGFAQIMWIA